MCRMDGLSLVSTPLLDCETVLMRLHRHWILIFAKSRIGLALVLVAIVLNLVFDFLAGALYQGVGVREGWPDFRTSPVAADMRMAVTFLLLAVGGLLVTRAWVLWSSVVITVTDYRFIKDSGTWPRTSMVIGLDRILDVSTAQTPWGKSFNYGTVKINTLDLGLDYIPSPEQVAADIFVHVTNLKRGGAKGPPPAVEELLEEEIEVEKAGEGNGHEPGH
jgi:membrane protein YdbS with pleckstrin-like domain